MFTEEIPLPPELHLPNRNLELRDVQAIQLNTQSFS